MKHIYKTAILLLTTSCLVGCGKAKNPERPATTKVSGVVLQDGQPVAGASISFFPVEPGGEAAFGKTDAEGKFKIGTFESDDGAIAGSYKVTVKKMEELTEASQASTDSPDYNPNYVAPIPKNLLPKKYADAATSGLTATVGTEKVTDLKLELAAK